MRHGGATGEADGSGPYGGVSSLLREFCCCPWAGGAVRSPPPAAGSAEGAQLNGRPSLRERVRVRGFVPETAAPLTPCSLPAGEGAKSPCTSIPIKACVPLSLVLKIACSSSAKRRVHDCT